MKEIDRSWREAVRILKEYDKRLNDLEDEREQDGAVRQTRTVVETATASDDVTVSTADASAVSYWDDGTLVGFGTWE